MDASARRSVVAPTDVTKPRTQERRLDRLLPALRRAEQRLTQATARRDRVCTEWTDVRRQFAHLLETLHVRLSHRLLRALQREPTTSETVEQLDQLAQLWMRVRDRNASLLATKADTLRQLSFLSSESRETELVKVATRLLRLRVRIAETALSATDRALVLDALERRAQRAPGEKATPATGSDDSLVDVHERTTGDRTHGGAAPRPSTTTFRRENLSAAARDALKHWLMNHLEHPYPNDEDKEELAAATGASLERIANWFINARLRIWRPHILNLGWTIHVDRAGRAVGVKKDKA